MPRQDRDENGRFAGKVRDQEILKVFDFETSTEDPFLTVEEVRDGLERHFDVELTGEGVRTRLESMRDDETIGRRDFGGAVAYRTTVAPALSEAVETRLERQSDRRADHDVVWSDDE